MIFQYKHLVKNLYAIPNLGSEYSITETVVPPDGEHSYRYNRMTLSYNGTDLFTFTKSYYPQVIKVHMEAILPLFPELIVYDFHQDTGYIKRHIMESIIDTLYNKYNPSKIGTKSGNIYKKVFRELASRSDNDWSMLTPRYDQMLVEVQNHFARLIGETDSVDEYQYKFNTHAAPFFKDRFTVCYCTKKVVPKARCTRYELLQGYRSFLKPYDPESIGMVKSETTGRWLLPHTYEWDGDIYHDDDPTSVCTCCGKTVPTSGINEESKECKVCEKERYTIQNYSTRAPDKLGFKAKNVTPSTLYLGIELEYETTNKDAARVKVGKALRGHAIMKSDGSIRNGFEIVTCPATIDIQLDVFSGFFEKIPEELKIDSNVGMHVHVSRKPLSSFTVGKITEFMNRSDNLDFITNIAGRKPNHFCNQDSRRVLTYPHTHNHTERYNTLNLNNKDTIEFRIFSTPMSYNDFAHKVQFCQALVDYSKPAACGAALKLQTHYKTFIDWVTPRRKQYPQLVSKLKGIA